MHLYFLIASTADTAERVMFSSTGFWQLTWRSAVMSNSGSKNESCPQTGRNRLTCSVNLKRSTWETLWANLTEILPARASSSFLVFFSSLLLGGFVVFLHFYHIKLNMFRFFKYWSDKKNAISWCHLGLREIVAGSFDHFLNDLRSWK